MKTDQDTPTGDNEKEITKTIEEIAPDDTTSVKEAQVVVDEDSPDSCLNCGYKTISLSACHRKCPNCGTEKDCSETAIC